MGLSRQTAYDCRPFKLFLFQKHGRASPGLHIGEFVRLFQWKSGYVGTVKERIEQQVSEGPRVNETHHEEAAHAHAEGLEPDHEPSASQLFVVENPDYRSRAWGGPLHGGDCFRLRHLATDRYLLR